MKRLFLLLLTGLASFIVLACGSGFHAPESAAIPDGHRFASPPHTRTLFASSIHIDQAGLSLIEGFEGFSSCPYWDPFGHVSTRGYGETDFSGHNFGGRCISRTQGQDNLRSKVESEYQWAVRGLGVSFTQHQVDALDSFVWNLGAGIFTGSLRTSVRHHNPYPLLAYDRAGGAVLQGLVNRRRAEVALFLEPEAAANPAAIRHARLHVLLRRDRALYRDLQARKCFTVHGHHAYHACPRWGREWRHTRAQIKALQH